MEFIYESKFRGTQNYSAVFEGVIPNLVRRYRQLIPNVRAKIEGYMAENKCEVCKGARLRDVALAVTIAGKNILK